MTVATHIARLLLLISLVFTVAALTACGITSDELSDKLRPMRDSQRETEEKLAELETRTSRHEEEMRERLSRLQSELEAELEAMDERYEEYQATALAFRDLYDDIDAIRQRNVEIYEGIYSMLDTMLDLYNEQASLMRDHSSRTTYVAQRVEAMLEDLDEFAPEPSGAEAD